MNADDTILVEEAGDVATVILNRPEKLNALTKSMWQRLGEVFEGLSARDDVRCIILRGAGTKAFAPGNDISEFATERSNVEQARAYGAVMRKTIEAIDHCRHPVVAQIHGICVGGGLEIAGLADIRICGESSRFGVPINKLGLVMAYAEIGSLKKDKAADFIAIDLGDLGSQPLYNVISQLVYASGRHQVTDVFVAGRGLLRNGMLQTLDEAAIAANATQWRDRIQP